MSVLWNKKGGREMCNFGSGWLGWGSLVFVAGWFLLCSVLFCSVLVHCGWTTFFSFPKYTKMYVNLYLVLSGLAIRAVAALASLPCAVSCNLWATWKPRVESLVLSARAKTWWNICLAILLFVRQDFPVNCFPCIPLLMSLLWKRTMGRNSCLRVFLSQTTYQFCIIFISYIILFHFSWKTSRYFLDERLYWSRRTFFLSNVLILLVKT